MAMNNLEIIKLKKDIEKFKEYEKSPTLLELIGRIERCIIILQERNKEKNAKIEVLKEVLTNK